MEKLCGQSEMVFLFFIHTRWGQLNYYKRIEVRITIWLYRIFNLRVVFIVYKPFMEIIFP